MRNAESTFKVTSFEPIGWTPDITTGLPTGHAHLVKEFTGEVQGRAVAQFSYSYDKPSSAGTYLALESFNGLVNEFTGAFNFVHSSTVEGGLLDPQLASSSRSCPAAVPANSWASQGRAMWVETDGSHHFRLDYELPDQLNASPDVGK